MIKLVNINKEFKTDDGIHRVLKDINLEINDGDFISIIGSNGSGKSTLLNVISGFYLPTSGKIILNDKDITKLKEHKKAKYIGRVFQDVNLGTIGDISIEENLALAYKRGDKRGLKWALKKEYLDIYKEKLSPLGLNLESRLKEPIKSLSGGQRQAITILMATLKRPDILLLDEHTAALDPKTSKKIMSLTEELIKEYSLTSIMVTHNMKDALKYGNRLIMIQDGRIICDVRDEEKRNLTIEEIYKHFENDEDNI